MKIDEILLEYDRARAAQAVGPLLWQAMIREILNLNVPLKDFQKSWEEKYPSSYKQYASVFTDKASQEKLMNNALEQLEQADPTTNKKYTQWLARMLASDPRTKLEDMKSTVAEYLHKFNILSRKKLLKPDQTDINRFKDIKTFMNVLDQYELPEEDQAKGKAEKLYSDDTVTVIHPEDQTAACAYGRQTRWCTAATRGINYFDNYNAQGPLYILIPKSPKHEGEKYQLHFPSASFMDENDNSVSLSKLISDRFPGLYEFFLAREKEHIAGLIEFASDEELTPILDQVSEIMGDIVNDISDEWAANDDYYYQWLQDEGYMNEEGDVDWDRAPSYFEYDPEADDNYTKMRHVTSLSPDEFRKLASEWTREESGELAKMSDIKSVFVFNIAQELGDKHSHKDTAGLGAELIKHLEKNVLISKNKEGKWEVKKVK